MLVADANAASGMACDAAARVVVRRDGTLWFTDPSYGDSGANQEAGSDYVNRPHRIVAFDVLDGRQLGSPRLFAVTIPGFPDGIKVDAQGRVYASPNWARSISAAQ